MRDRFRLWHTAEVRWGDMDSFGHVNNAKYFTYCESARILYFEEGGFFDYHEELGQAPVLVSGTVNYRRQVRYPATLEVGVRVTKIGRSSFHHEYAIFQKGEGEDEVVADGTSVCAWIDYGAEQSMPLPAKLRARIREIDPDVPD